MQAFQRLNRIQQDLLLRQSLAVIGQHLVARLGRFDAAPMALQQGGTQLLFQLRYLAADRRRRNVEEVGGSPDAAQSYGFEKVQDASILNEAHGLPVLR